MVFNWVRFTNWVILIATITLGITGGLGLFWTTHPWIFDIHRIAGWLLIGMIPAKAVIVYRSLKRGVPSNINQGIIKGFSIVLAMITIMVVGLGVVWMWRLAPDESWLRQTVISWHWMIGLVLIAPFMLHVWKRWQKPKTADYLSRRGAIRVIGIALFSLCAWFLSEQYIHKKSGLFSVRRFTGSREKGSFRGNDFPVTNNAGEGHTPVDLEDWRLIVDASNNGEREYSYHDLEKLEISTMKATIDCTLGWFSTQEWSGIPLTSILSIPPEIRGKKLGVRIESVSGYGHTFPMNEAKEILLATQVGGQQLDHWHGFPLRAVVPQRRGWFWVKWITRIQVVRLE